MQDSSIEIDGFPLIIHKTANGTRLLGDADKKIYDGQSAVILSTPISLVTNMLDNNEPNWKKILSGEGVTYGVAGCVPAEKDDINCIKAIKYYTFFFKKKPDSAMWYIWFDELTNVRKTYIPYNTLKSILSLAVDLATNKEIKI